MSTEPYAGLLFIGDPHLSSRIPGFRKDDYPETVLAKLEGVLKRAREERLLPVILGDLFHWPRDNANWLLVRVIMMLRGQEVLAVVGNHDTRLRDLESDDSLALLEAVGCIRFVDRQGPWIGRIGERQVVVGGTSWSAALPKSFDSETHHAEPDALVVWITHHDVLFSGYEESGVHRPRDIPGIHLVVNGHIHRPLEQITHGSTTWVNPGNIARVARGDGHAARRPAVMRLDVRGQVWGLSEMEVPHQSYESVFHITETVAPAAPEISAFVKGLESLRTLRTRSGAGLMEFLEQNLMEEDAAVRADIMELAREVVNEGAPDE